MSPELVSAIQAYNQQIEANSENFSNAITQLETLYTELETLKHHVPENHNTTDFSQYGLVELEEKRDSYKHIMSLYLNQTKNPAYSTNHELCQKAESEILLRKTQISAKESEIENQQKKIRKEKSGKSITSFPNLPRKYTKLFRPRTIQRTVLLYT